MNTNIQNTKHNNATWHFYPMLVSSEKGAVDSGEAAVLRWKKFKTLPEKSREILLSEEVPRVIKSISDNLKLASQQTEEISRLIRNVFFGNIKRENIASELAQKIEINEQQAQDIEQEIKNKIFLLSPQKHSLSKQNASIIKISIFQALKKYPGVGEQLITANRIRIGNNPEPIKPSVRNWIMDYRHTKGDDVYEDLERGNYLFHGKNTSKLTFPERQKLSLILKSLDNNTLLSIDTRRRQIIFPQTKIAAEQKMSSAEKQPVKADWNEMKNHWQKETSERERNGRQSISKGVPRERQTAAKSLGSIKDFSFSSPQRFESEGSLDNLNRAESVGARPPVKPASNDLDDVHSALEKQAMKIKSHKYQIYPIGSSVVNKNGAPPAAGHKAKPKTKGNVVNLREDF